MTTASPCSGPLFRLWSAPFLDAAAAHRRRAVTRSPRRGSRGPGMAEQQKQTHRVER